MKNNTNTSNYSITATLKKMKRGECFDLPETAGSNGGISAHSAAKQLGAGVIVRQNAKGGFRVFLSTMPDKAKVNGSREYKILSGIALPSGGRGRPPGVLNAPKGGKGKVAKAKKAPAKVVSKTKAMPITLKSSFSSYASKTKAMPKKVSKASNKAKLVSAKSAPVPAHLAKAAK